MINVTVFDIDGTRQITIMFGGVPTVESEPISLTVETESGESSLGDGEVFIHYT